MKPDEVAKIGQDVGIKPDGETKQTRKSKRENIKRMTVKAKDKELAQLRKETDGQKIIIGDLEKQVPGEGVEQFVIKPEFYGFLMDSMHRSLAKRFGDHWLLKEDEMMRYGNSIHAVVVRYFNVANTKYPELIALAGVVGSINLERGIVTWTIIKQKKQMAETVKTESTPGTEGEQDAKP